MADITKYAPINGGTFISDFKSHCSILRTKRTVSVAYAFVFVFIAFTIFLAFSPSSNSSSPWFTNIFTVSSSSSSTTSPTSSSIFSDESYRSHFSSIYNYFFPNSSSSSSSSSSTSSSSSSSSQSHNGYQGAAFLPPISNTGPPAAKSETKDEAVTHKGEVLKPKSGTILPSVNHTVNNITTPPRTSSELSKGSPDIKNQTQNKQLNDKSHVLKQNQTQSEEFHDKVEVPTANQSTIGATNSPETANKTVNSSPKPATAANGGKGIAEKGGVKNLTSSLMKKRSNGTKVAMTEQGNDDLIKSLMNCDLFDGNWVKDDSYPLYKPGSCSLIDEQFNCFLNGRPDDGYHKLKWKPKGCALPRLDGSHMLEMLRGKRLVFVGDSLNRNMWESLICILRNSVRDQKKVYEVSGRHHFRTEASYSFVFEDYKCTVEFFVAPFLVQEWEVVGRNGTKKETLRLDIISRSADKYKNADIIVFNTGHWWTHEKTSTGKDYYQEGSHVYSDLNVLEAFRKALTTWGRWVDANINPKKSFVFFRGYSASHFSGGQWNSGGQCDHETEPIKNETYLMPYPPKMTVLEKVLKGMKTRVTYLNVTRMTDYRKDGHPSIYRKLHMSDEEKRSLSIQDCSHWCLPGVPDAWNEMLYAELLVKLYQKRQQKHA